MLSLILNRGVVFHDIPLKGSYTLDVRIYVTLFQSRGI